MDKTPGQQATQVLKSVWDSTIEACTGLAPIEWDRPTDCPGWTVKDVLSHVIGIERMMMGDATPPHEGAFGAHVVTPFGEMNEAWVEARRDRPGDEVLAEFKEVTDMRLAQLAALSDEEFDVVGWSPVGQVPYVEFLRVRALDCWVHEQDMRRALNRPGGMGGAGQAIAIDWMTGYLPYVIGKKIAPPAGTTVVWTVEGPENFSVAVESDGKRASQLQEIPPHPTATITLSSDAYWRLGCGRVTPDEAMGAGQVQLQGEHDLGLQVLGAMKLMM